MSARVLVLTGTLGPACNGKLMLILTDGPGRPDFSWRRLKGFGLPHLNAPPGATDAGGSYGYVHLALPRSTANWLGLAETLRRRRVVATVDVKKYDFVSTAAHNAGQRMRGARLVLRNLVAEKADG